jgi:hypothetical protein
VDSLDWLESMEVTDIFDDGDIEFMMMLSGWFEFLVA